MSNLNKFRKSTVAILTAILLISIAMPLLVSTVGATTVATISLGDTSSGPLGTTVTVTGSGFTANLAAGALSLTFGGLTTAWTGSTGSTTTTGTTTSTFVVPTTVTAGQYLVVVSDASGNTASATFTVTEPTVAVSPSSGISGSTAVVSGSGFFPGATISVATLNDVPVTLSTTTVSALGTIYATFTIPNVASLTAYTGAATLLLKDSYNNVITASVTLNCPSIDLSSNSAAAGSKITITGSGFAPDTVIALAYGRTNIALATEPSQVVSSTAGTFTAVVTVPTGVSQGSITIKAFDDSSSTSNIASASLSVTPALAIVMDYGVGNANTNTVPATATSTIKVTGYGFAASSDVTLSWFPTTPSNTFAAITTDATGAFTVTSNAAAMSATPGTWTLTATDASGNSMDAQLVVTASGTYWILSPVSGPVGTTVTATYFGGAHTTLGHITVGGATACADVLANPAPYPTGDTQTFIIPNLNAGPYTVSGTGDWSAFSADFTVTNTAPTLAFKQTSGAKGQYVEFSGANYIPGSTVTFTVQTVSIDTTTASSTGTISGLLQIPTYQIGTYKVTASDGRNVATANLGIVQPTVTLSATTFPLVTGGAATRISFNATGFGSGSFTATLGGQACIIDTTLMTAADGLGVAYGAFTVPNNLVAGQQTLIISDGVNSYTVKVTVQPSIALSQTAVPAGNSLTLTGYGFAATSKLSLQLNGTFLALSTGLVAGATTTGTGSVPGSVTFKVPATQEGGSYIVKVSDYATVNNTATTTIAITSPTMTLTPNSGAAGITVTVTGAGWLPGVINGKIKFGNTQVAPALRTGASGTADEGKIIGGNTFTVPSVPTGNYTITVSDGVESVTATFTVMTAAIELSASSGNVGDVITITGSGFNPGTFALTGPGAATLTLGGRAITSLATGYNTPNVYENGTLGCTNSVTNAPVMGLPIEIPAGNVASVKTLQLAFSSGLTTTTTFTILPKITASPTAGILKGTPMTITAKGFAAYSTLTATLNGAAIVITSGATTAAMTDPVPGTATPVFTIPVTAAAGVNTLIVTDAAGNSATVNITIGTPSIASLSATSGPAGTSVQVTGTGFYAGSQIFVSFDGLSLTTSPPTITATSGSFIAFITVPTGTAVGEHVIAATDSNNNQASASFNVTSSSTGSALPDTALMASTAKTTTASGTATTAFTAGSTVEAGFTLQSASGSRNVIVSVTFQQGAKVYGMLKQTATMDTTARPIAFDTLIPAGATGTWTAQLQIFAADGVTALGVTTLNFTVA